MMFQKVHRKWSQKVSLLWFRNIASLAYEEPPTTFWKVQITKQNPALTSKNFGRQSKYVLILFFLILFKILYTHAVITEGDMRSNYSYLSTSILPIGPCLGCQWQGWFYFLPHHLLNKHIQVGEWEVVIKKCLLFRFTQRKCFKRIKPFPRWNVSQNISLD